MNDYQIITDSTCDITQQMADELDVLVIPMEFTLDDQNYRNYPDEREMTNQAFYEAMRSEKRLYHTNHRIHFSGHV